MSGVLFNNKHWFFKYKIHHLIFWAVYHFSWWSLYSGNVAKVAGHIFFSTSSIKFIFYVVFQALGVYVNLYFLMPKLLDKGRYLPYILSVILTIIVTALVIPFGYYLSAIVEGISVSEMFDVSDPSIFHFFRFNSLPSTVSAMTLAMSIKLGWNWMLSKEKERALEKEKLKTELKFLKSQFNPHFLFNMINSIFFLIHDNPDRASDTLAKFSDLLRYQLYECNESEISLSKEKEYIKNFIKLESLRLNQNIDLKYDIGDLKQSNLMIAPFIIMPFIENAFKHISNHNNKENFIDIKLETIDSSLFLSTKNTKDGLSRAESFNVNYKGLGLKNVKRRLDLIYPGDYEIKINEDQDIFELNLRLNLRSLENEKVAKRQSPAEISESILLSP